MHSKRGFTIIELLVVIAIIALLAAILFPVFAMAKRSSQRTVALSNIAQIGKAMHMYVAGYDDTLPFHFEVKPEWPGYHVIILQAGAGFAPLYEPYLPDNRVWFSPADRLADKGSSSFSVNEQLAYAWPLSSIPRPSEAIYLTDRTDIAIPNQAVVDTYVWWQFTDQIPFSESTLPGKVDPVSVASQIDPIRYADNVAAYLFLDGHAITAPFERTWGDATHNLHLATKS